MTYALATATGSPPRPASWRHLQDAWVVAIAAGAAVALRLPLLTRPAGPDEAGFLLVGQQWRPGASLYGSYWVDRPPVLITLFRLADRLGGLVALRLLGCVAVVLAIAGVWVSGRMVGGARAGVWSAVVAAGLLSSTLMGSFEVNGELLAAPATAWGVALALRSLARRPGVVCWAAMGAGACGATALLIKQNMAEVLVFAVAVWVLASRHGRGDRAALRRRLVSGLLGAVAAVGLVAAWALWHGTSPGGVFYAMYPFRLQAARSLLAESRASTIGRFGMLLLRLAVSGTPVLVWLLVRAVRRRRLRGPVPVALIILLAFSTASILAGGGYWSHYLVELAVPMSLAAGMLAIAEYRIAQRVTAAVVAIGVVSVVVSAVGPVRSPGQTVGLAVARSARPGDSIVSLFGSADIVRASGLAAPYPYLWALPAATLDHEMHVLDSTLRGRTPPTWVVLRDQGTYRRLTSEVRGVLRTAYMPVAEVCGRVVYLRNGDGRWRTPGSPHC